MKIWHGAIMGTAALAAGLLLAPAQAEVEHVVLAPDAVQWGPAPASLPAGAEAAVLMGDPSKEGQFALRIKLPSGYHIAPHTHPALENVTVLSGKFMIGMGETADRSKASPLPAGGFVSMAPGTAHYVYADEETIVQLNSVGPWSLTYINPADDPRKTQ